MGFSVQVGEQAGRPVVTCSGELDAHASPQVVQALAPLTSVPGCALIVDLSDVDFMDSMGLGVLVTGLKHAREVGGSVAIVVVSPRVLKVFQLTGLDGVFSLHETLDAAIAHA